MCLGRWVPEVQVHTDHGIDNRNAGMGLHRELGYMSSCSCGSLDEGLEGAGCSGAAVEGKLAKITGGAAV